MIRFPVMRHLRVSALVAAFSSLAVVVAVAAAPAHEPYFVSVKVQEAYMREGPSDMHRVKWIYRRKGLPLEVLATFEVWRRVRDMDGEIGWMHTALLSRERTAMVTAGTDVQVYARDDVTSDIVAVARPGAMGQLLGCSDQACEVAFSGADGWVARARLWGIHAGEEF